MSELLLTAREIGALLRINQASLYRRMADGTIPKPVKLGDLSRWPKYEILAAVKATEERKPV
jgi:predicted DNA-binding transcriptional regulator AlpA